VQSWARNAWLLGAVGALAAWLNAGIDVAGSDQQLYVPYIRHFAHPELYPGDYIFDNENYRATLFVPLVGGLHRLVGGDWVPLLYVVHLLSLFILFSGLAATAARLSRGPAPAWLVAFLSWPPPIPGAAAALYEPTPHPRTLAAALIAWSLRHALDGHAVASALLVGAAVAVHPLSGVAAALGVALAFTVGIREDAAARRRLGRFAVAALVTLALVRASAPVRAALPLAPAGWWQSVATSGFLWYWGWTRAVVLSLLLWTVLLIVSQRRDDLAAARVLRFGQAFAPLYALGLVGMLLRSPLLVSLQLARAGGVLIMAALLLTARRLTDDLEARRLPLPIYVATAALPLTQSLGPIFVGLVLALVWPRLSLSPRAAWAATATLAVVIAARFRPHREHTPLGDDWVAVQRWAATATPVDARFLAPPRVPDFRVFSGRASVVGQQDMQPAIFNRAYAAEWMRRAPALAGYAGHDCDALVDAARRFAARYVVTDWACALPLVHRQGPWRVYDAKMPSP
jgi:hypothetical protein